MTIFFNVKVIAKLVGWRITGHHQMFGKIYDSIGFPANMLKDLVIARIVHPKSKLSTIKYLRRFLGIGLSIDKAYRFLDAMDKNQLTEIAFKFVSGKHQCPLTLYLSNKPTREIRETTTRGVPDYSDPDDIIYLSDIQS